MQNDLQNLIDGKSFEEAKAILEPCGVFMKRHPKYNNLVQFSYDQIEGYAHRMSMFSRNSRGIILNESDNWSTVCYPFNRFFNAGESGTEDFNWKDPELVVYEKVDGSLLSMYYYMGKWNVCTRNSPDAGGSLNSDSNETFTERFWKTFHNMGMNLDYYIPGYTYMFELTTPENMVVVSHTENKLTLLGIRNNSSHNELRPITVVDPKVVHVKVYPLKTLEEIYKAAEEIDPIKSEGFVVCDGSFNRLKVKSPKYVALHHMVSDFSVRNCIRLIQIGEESELFAYYPQYQQKYQEVKNKIENYITLVQNHYTWVNQQMPENGTQKDFAALALTTVDPGILFALRKGEYKSVREAVMSKHVYKIEECIL